MNLTAVLIPIYLAAVIAIVVISGRKSKTFKDYALADGKLPWFVLTGTIIASLANGTLVNTVGTPVYNPASDRNWIQVEFKKRNRLMTGWVAASIVGLRRK